MTFDPSGWLQRFVLPLVAGGDVRVQTAIGSHEVALLATGSWEDDEAARRIADARQAIMAEILIDPPAPSLDEPSIRLAAAMQNLLFLLHPASGGVGVRKSKAARLARYSVELAHLPAAENAVALAARHSILAHLFDLGRDDVRVSFWAGKHEFKGAEPPPRLLRWGSLRRVREERWRVLIATEAAGDAAERQIVIALLQASPLTDLLEPARLDPPFDLEESTAWLGEPTIARAVADRWLALGIPRLASPVGTALVKLYERKLTSAARLATEFVCHLHLLALMSGPSKTRPERVLELQAQAQAQAALRDFYGLFAAAQRVGLGRPPDLAQNPRLAEEVAAYAGACQDVAGLTRVNELAGLMARGAAGPLALTGTANL